MDKSEWEQLLREARELGLTVKEIEEFFKAIKKKEDLIYVTD